jgi:hypothetical protein
VPDGRLDGEQWLVDGDHVVLPWTFSGTHTGELLGMPPTGRDVTTTGMCMFRFAGDRIAETWVSYDALGFLSQLGLVQIGRRRWSPDPLRPARRRDRAAARACQRLVSGCC